MFQNISIGNSNFLKFLFKKSFAALLMPPLIRNFHSRSKRTSDNPQIPSRIRSFIMDRQNMTNKKYGCLLRSERVTLMRLNFTEF